MLGSRKGDKGRGAFNHADEFRSKIIIEVILFKRKRKIGQRIFIHPTIKIQCINIPEEE